MLPRRVGSRGRLAEPEWKANARFDPTADRRCSVSEEREARRWLRDAKSSATLDGRERFVAAELRLDQSCEEGASFLGAHQELERPQEPRRRGHADADLGLAVDTQNRCGAGLCVLELASTVRRYEAPVGRSRARTSVANSRARREPGPRSHESRYAWVISTLFAPSSRMSRQTAKKASAS